MLVIMALNLREVRVLRTARYGITDLTDEGFRGAYSSLRIYVSPCSRSIYAANWSWARAGNIVNAPLALTDDTPIYFTKYMDVFINNTLDIYVGGDVSRTVNIEFIDPSGVNLSMWVFCIQNYRTVAYIMGVSSTNSSVSFEVSATGLYRLSFSIWQPMAKTIRICMGSLPSEPEFRAAQMRESIPYMMIYRGDLTGYAIRITYTTSTPSGSPHSPPVQHEGFVWFSYHMIQATSSWLTTVAGNSMTFQWVDSFQLAVRINGGQFVQARLYTIAPSKIRGEIPILVSIGSMGGGSNTATMLHLDRILVNRNVKITYRSTTANRNTHSAVTTGGTIQNGTQVLISASGTILTFTPNHNANILTVTASPVNGTFWEVGIYVL